MGARCACGSTRTLRGHRQEERPGRVQEGERDVRGSSSLPSAPAKEGTRARRVSGARDAACEDGARTLSQAPGRALTATFSGRLKTSMSGSMSPWNTTTFFDTRSLPHPMESMEEMARTQYIGISHHILESRRQRLPPSRKDECSHRRKNLTGKRTYTHT